MSIHHPMNFDLNIFSLSLAFHLLGTERVRGSLKGVRDNESSFQLFWRSCPLSASPADAAATEAAAAAPTFTKIKQKQWRDVIWECSSSSSTIHLKIGWAQTLPSGLLSYRQTTCLDPSAIAAHLEQVSVDLETTPVDILAKTFARALQCTWKTQQYSSENESLELYYEELQQSAKLPLKGMIREFDTLATEWLLHTMQFNPSSTPDQAMETTNLPTVSELQSIWDDCQKRLVSTPRTHNASSLADSASNNNTHTQTAKTETQLPATNQSPPKKKTLAVTKKRHGYAKVALNRRKPGKLKFASQK